MAFLDIEDIPVFRDTFYVVDLTAAFVDLTSTPGDGSSPAVGSGAVGVGAIGEDSVFGTVPTYDDAVETTYPFAEIDWQASGVDIPVTIDGLPLTIDGELIVISGGFALYDGRVDNFEIERTIPLNPFSEIRNTFGVGRVTLANIDRYLRDLTRDYSIEGRQVDVAIGSLADTRSEFTTMFSGVAETWGTSTSDHVIVELRDKWRKLTTDPRPLYLGIGGADGGPELTGKPQVLWLGYRSNVPCVKLEDPTGPIFHLSYLGMNDVSSVKSRGVELTPAGIVADVFDSGLVVAPGTWVWSPTQGKIRLGTEPEEPVTATGEGLVSGSAYLSTSGEIALWILQELVGIDAAEIDSAAFDALYDGEVGLWIGTDPMNANTMIDRILGPINWWGDDEQGMITAGGLGVPSMLGTPGGSITSDQILEGTFSRLDWPAGAPFARIRIAYNGNDIVQPFDVDVAAPTAWKNYIKEPYEVFPLESAVVAQSRLGAADPDPIVTPYKDVASASYVAQVLLQLNEGRVGLYRLTVSDDRVRYPLGHVFNLTDDQVSDVEQPALIAGTSYNAESRQATYTIVT